MEPLSLLVVRSLVWKGVRFWCFVCWKNWNLLCGINFEGFCVGLSHLRLQFLLSWIFFWFFWMCWFVMIAEFKWIDEWNRMPFIWYYNFKCYLKIIIQIKYVHNRNINPHLWHFSCDSCKTRIFLVRKFFVQCTLRVFPGKFGNNHNTTTFTHDNTCVYEKHGTKIHDIYI